MKACEEGGPGLIPLWVRTDYRGEKELHHARSKKSMPVTVYDADGELEARYDSVGKAAKATGWSRAVIMSGLPVEGKRIVVDRPELD